MTKEILPLVLVTAAEWRGQPMPSAAEAFVSVVTHRAAMVRAGRITRQQALEALQRRLPDLLDDLLADERAKQ